MPFTNSKFATYKLSTYEGELTVENVAEIQESGSFTYFSGPESVTFAIKTERIYSIGRVDD